MDKILKRLPKDFGTKTVRKGYRCKRFQNHYRINNVLNIFTKGKKIFDLIEQEWLQFDNVEECIETAYELATKYHKKSKKTKKGSSKTKNISANLEKLREKGKMVDGVLYLDSNISGSRGLRNPLQVKAKEARRKRSRKSYTDSMSRR